MTDGWRPGLMAPLQGTDVYRPQGDTIGSIDHLMIDKSSGKVTYAVMNFGGLLGFVDKHHPLPQGALSYDPALGEFRTNVTENQLNDAPALGDESWRDRSWES
jgi:PRC-barrel domain